MVRYIFIIIIDDDDDDDDDNDNDNDYYWNDSCILTIIILSSLLSSFISIYLSSSLLSPSIHPSIHLDNDQAASFRLIDATLGQRKLGPSVAVDSYGIAVGVTNVNPFDVRNPHPR
jgi:hypothetical protein